MNTRKIRERIMKFLMIISLLFVLVTLLLIILIVCIKGIRAFSFSNLYSLPKGSFYTGTGKGGIANAIVGSLYLTAGSSFIAVLAGIPIAFSLQRDFIRPKTASVCRFNLDILCGIPSIVFGAFGFLLMRILHLRASLLAGIISLSIMILPVYVRSLDNIMQLVPFTLRENSYAMGASAGETAFKVVFRQILPAVFTSLILAAGRALGDSACILFTAGYTDNIPKTLSDPAASLPLSVFFQSMTPVESVRDMAYVSGMVLLVLVLLFTVSARIIQKKLSKYSSRRS